MGWVGAQGTGARHDGVCVVCHARVSLFSRPPTHFPTHFPRYPHHTNALRTMVAHLGRLALSACRTAGPLHSGASAPLVARRAAAVARARQVGPAATSSLQQQQQRGYARPSQVNQMATPVDVKPETRAGRGSTQKVFKNGAYCCYSCGLLGVLSHSLSDAQAPLTDSTCLFSLPASCLL